MATLFQQWKQGNLTTTQYHDQLKSLNASRNALASVPDKVQPQVAAAPEPVTMPDQSAQPQNQSDVVSLRNKLLSEYQGPNTLAALIKDRLQQDIDSNLEPMRKQREDLTTQYRGLTTSTENRLGTDNLERFQVGRNMERELLWSQIENTNNRIKDRQDSINQTISLMAGAEGERQAKNIQMLNSMIEQQKSDIDQQNKLRELTRMDEALQVQKLATITDLLSKVPSGKKFSELGLTGKVGDIDIGNMQGVGTDKSSVTVVQDNVLGGFSVVDKETGTPLYRIDASGNRTNYTGSTPGQGTSYAPGATPSSTQTAAVRNNNPGNIKVPAGGIEVAQARYGDPRATVGSQATDGGYFIKFSDVTKGLAAIPTLLNTVYPGMDIDSALRKWSGGGYGVEIAPELKGKKVGGLTQQETERLMQAMIQREDGNMYASLYGNQNPSVLSTEPATAATSQMPSVNVPGNAAYDRSTVEKMAVKAGKTPKEITQILYNYDRTGSVPSEIEQNYKYGRTLTADEQKKVSGLEAGVNTVGQIEKALKEIPAFDGVQARIQGYLMQAQAMATGEPSYVMPYIGLTKGLATVLMRGLGEVGNMSDNDIKRAMYLIPELTDTREERTRKIANLKELFKTIQGGYSEKADMFSAVKQTLDNINYNDVSNTRTRDEAIKMLQDAGKPTTEANIEFLMQN